MEISFKFNNGETAQEIIAAITGLFGMAPAGATVARVQTATVGQPAVLAPADNPAVGAEPEESGPTSTQTHDAAGVPHDARIHSDKRTLTEKGLWRKRKGVQDTTVTAVMAELQAKGLIAAPAAAPVAPSAPPAIAAPAAPQPLAPAGMPQQLALPATAPVAPPALAPVETPYTKFVNFLAGHMHSTANPSGRLTEEYVSNALMSLGVTAPDGTGKVQALESADAARITQVHNAFAGVLGVAGV